RSIRTESWRARPFPASPPSAVLSTPRLTASGAIRAGAANGRRDRAAGRRAIASQRRTRWAGSSESGARARSRRWHTAGARDGAETALDRALAAHRKSTIVLAHGGEGPPGRLDRLLLRNSNLFVDLSGMHFQRTPALASETGPMDGGWKALIEKYPDRFMIGV